MASVLFSAFPQILRNDTNLRSADAELQQRAVEYLQLSKIASGDILATVLEEMPAFPERESGILAKLKKQKEIPDNAETPKEQKHLPQAIVHNTDAVPVKNFNPLIVFSPFNVDDLLLKYSSIIILFLFLMIDWLIDLSDSIWWFLLSLYFVYRFMPLDAGTKWWERARNEPGRFNGPAGA